MGAGAAATGAVTVGDGRSAVRVAAGVAVSLAVVAVLACQYWAEVRAVFSIPRTAFHPVPEVESALVRFDLRDVPRVRPADPQKLIAVIRAAFAVRRKTLRNALCRAGWTGPSVDAALERVGVHPMRRGETLALEEFARLSDALPGGVPHDEVPAGAGIRSADVGRRVREPRDG